MSWVDSLVAEYKTGRNQLKNLYDSLDDKEHDKLDKTQINSMIDSITYSIVWMELGKDPDSNRGIDKKDAYRILRYDDMDIIPDITSELKKESEPIRLNKYQRRILIDLFERFSNRERQCYIMYKAEQLSMQQIADKLKISKSTVQSYIKRAENKVKKVVS